MKIRDLEFQIEYRFEDDILYGAKIDQGRITVLDRLTGYSYDIRDVETGFRDLENKFWLASGNFDIREYPYLEICEAIEMIKRCSNTCKGE